MHAVLDKFQIKHTELTSVMLSLIFHLLVLASVLIFQQSKPTPLNTLVKINLLTSEQEHKEQIISLSEAKESKHEPISKLLDSKNRYTKKESIKRGIPAKTIQPLKAFNQNTKPNQKKASLNVLKLNDKQIKDALPYTPKKSASERLSNSVPKSDYTPFRQTVSPSLSEYGSADHLPSIQDGEITLLNTKAHKYAVFVRRVALQVFGVLRRLSWTQLSKSQIYQLQQHSEVVATLDSKGNLVKVSLSGSSGVMEFDNLLLEAGKTGAWDKNPPPSAAMPDGTFKFVFRAKTWSRSSADGISEQRWLLLSTALL